MEKDYTHLARAGQRAKSLWLFLAIAGLAAPLHAQENEDCLACHEIEGLKMQRDGREVDLSVDPERFAESLHGGLDCVICHADLMGQEEFPHAQGLERVDCLQCHDDEDGPVTAWRESTHGQEAAKGNPLAPLCQDCHGSHYIVPLDEPDSATAPFNIPAMCAQCHAEGAPVERVYDLPQEQILKRYRQSIHGEGLYKQGLVVTAVCSSCHTGHSILPHTDPRSTIHKDRVTGTCMQCHGLIEEVHRKVIAGQLWEREGAVPVCVDCHSPHEARRVYYDTNMADADCLGCHAREDLRASADGRALTVSAEEHQRSVHGRKGVTCSQCHADVSPSEERACSTITGKVACDTCHEAQVRDYESGRHGRLHAVGDENAPYCTDCHGTHGILESSLPDGATPAIAALVRSSPTYTRNVPDLCARCHREGAPAARRYLGPEEHIVANYRMSIHGRGLLESGLTVTATCADCHTPHKELPASDPESSVSKAHIADTCGHCHEGIEDLYARSVHSTTGNPDYVQLRGMPELPHCNDCHSSHTIPRSDLPAFKFGVIEQCGKCHEEVAATYFESYHGKATELGATTRAKCYDCHNAHDILPPEDPNSPLSKEHIVQTCGQCHEGSNPGFAAYIAHADHRNRERYPALYYAWLVMTSLLVAVFVFFGLHLLAWLPRSWKLRRQHQAELAAIPREPKQFLRFPRFYRGMHATVIVSFFGLAITGMTLKFAHAGWARFLAHVFGGVTGAGLIHRLCALVTFGYFFTHIGDVLLRWRRSGKSARAFFFGPDTLVPRWSDLRELAATVRWFLGRGPMPRYGRWTYWEKFDYFAVFWGVAVIGSTGLFLWFPEFFTRLLPGWAINVATIIHSDEALLATGFIFTIHFFNTHLRPEKFPMDPVIFTGRMTMRELKHDRSRLYQELLAKGELEEHLVDPATEPFLKGARFFAYTALLVGVTLVGLIVYALLTA